MFALNKGHLKTAGLNQSRGKSAGLNQSRGKSAGLNQYRGKSQTRASFLAGHLNAILLDPKKYVDVVPYQVENALRKQMMANNELNKFLSLPPEKGRLLARLGFEQKLRNQAKSARNTSREVMNKHAHNLSSVLMRLQTNEKKQRKLLIAEKLFRSKDPSNMELLSLYRQIQQAKSLLEIEEFGDPILIVGSNVNRLNLLKRLGLLNESNNAVLKARPRAAAAEGRAAARAAESVEAAKEGAARAAMRGAVRVAGAASLKK